MAMPTSVKIETGKLYSEDNNRTVNFPQPEKESSSTKINSMAVARSVNVILVVLTCYVLVCFINRFHDKGRPVINLKHYDCQIFAKKRKHKENTGEAKTEKQHGSRPAFYGNF